MRKLIHTVDNNSTKAEKYVEHGTQISKLIPDDQAWELRSLANDLRVEEANEQ